MIPAQNNPAGAQHGADRGQVDISAAVIRVFERFGWAARVYWPAPPTSTAAAAAPAGPDDGNR